MRQGVSLLPAHFLLLTIFTVPSCCGHAQQATLRTRTNLVLVPTLVQSETGEPVFNLHAKDFLVTDDGVEQTIHLDADTYDRPISIVVLVQVGRSAVREFYKYRGLSVMVNALAGDTPHRIAVVEFDSQPRMLQNFTSNPNVVEQAIGSIRPGDGGAAILDSVWYAVDMLADEPVQNERVILLLSETRDHGSRTPMTEVLRKIGQSDVVVYSLAFSPARADLLDFSGSQGGVNVLAPVKMAIAALRKNTAAAIPQMTGGQFFHFGSGKRLDSELGMLANQVHNRYILSFQPSNPQPGLHTLRVVLRQPLDVKVLARRSYWAADTPTVMEETPVP